MANSETIARAQACAYLDLDEHDRSVEVARDAENLDAAREKDEGAGEEDMSKTGPLWR